MLQLNLKKNFFLLTLAPLSFEPVITKLTMLTKSRPLEIISVRWSIFPQPFVKALSDNLFNKFWSWFEKNKISLKLYQLCLI